MLFVRYKKVPRRSEKKQRDPSGVLHGHTTAPGGPDQRRKLIQAQTRYTRDPTPWCAAPIGVPRGRRGGSPGAMVLSSPVRRRRQPGEIVHAGSEQDRASWMVRISSTSSAGCAPWSGATRHHALSAHRAHSTR